MIWMYHKDNGKTLDLSYQKEFEKIWKWIKENNLRDISPGRHDIDGNNLYVNILNYDTKN